MCFKLTTFLSYGFKFLLVWGVGESNIDGLAFLANWSAVVFHNDFFALFWSFETKSKPHQHVLDA